MVQDIKLQKAEDGKGLSTNDYTNEDKEKVDAIPANPKYTDTVYTHPNSHPASMITQDSARRMVSDAQIANWDGKASGNHTHDIYLQKSGGVASGRIKAHPSSSWDAEQIRNIVYTTTAPTSATGYSEGTIIMVIE